VNAAAPVSDLDADLCRERRLDPLDVLSSSCAAAPA
jgi:hypothetical protein